MSLPHVYIEPVECDGIHVGTVLDLSDTSMTFNGSFYSAQYGRMFPEWILYRTDTHQHFHIALTSYKEHEDTSEFWSDEEEGGRICLSPTHVITVTWRVIATLQTNQEVAALEIDLRRRRREFLRNLDAVRSPTPTSIVSDDNSTQ
jgi:hypothetical protein